MKKRVRNRSHGGAGPFQLRPMESVDEWFVRLDGLLTERGCYSRFYQWRRWISPVIGQRQWPDVTAAHIERIRDDLDGAIARHLDEGAGRGRLAPITAYDVWFLLRGAIRKARTTKHRALRALDGRPDPSGEIEPPGEHRMRAPRQRPFIFPREHEALLSCDQIPLLWRELYAVAAYSYLRAGELTVLRWGDIDLVAGLMRVTKALHYGTRAIKAPKTSNGVRDVPIERALTPLLVRMRRRAADDALVIPILSNIARSSLPRVFRRHLIEAGVTRAALHVSSMTTAPSTFRSLRVSGITWLALAGHDALRIMRRAGHDDLSTTMRYVKQAEDLTGRLGRPFGPLPRSLVRG